MASCAAIRRQIEETTGMTIWFVMTYAGTRKNGLTMMENVAVA